MELLVFNSSQNNSEAKLILEIQFDVYKNVVNELEHIWYLWIHVEGEIPNNKGSIYREFYNQHLQGAFKKVFTAAAINLSAHVNINEYISLIKDDVLYHNVYTYFFIEVLSITDLSPEELAYLEPFLKWPPEQ